MIYFHFSSLSLVFTLSVYAYYFFRLKFLASAFIILSFGGFLVELLGISTGFPFGEYVYTGKFQPQILGIPIQVIIGWFVLGLICYSIALRFRSRLARVVSASALMVSWDVLYDPVFSKLGFWTWKDGQYFGVPVSNFLGWFVSSILFFTILELARTVNPKTSFRLQLPPIAVYLAYALDGAIQNAVSGQAFAGAIGAVSMLSCLWIVISRVSIRALKEM